MSNPTRRVSPPAPMIWHRSNRRANLAADFFTGKVQMLEDRYGLPVSTTSRAALDAYVDGADRVLAGIAGADVSLGLATQADPGWSLPHIAQARALFLEGEVARAREAAGRARSLAEGGTAREQGHVHALALAIEGKPAQALETTLAHLRDHPRDAMVLAPATGVFGLIGFSGWQDREAELYDLLRTLAVQYGADWWFDCVYAFAACESGRLDEALVLIERSMKARRNNAHGAHVQAHVLHERGSNLQALAFLQDWLPSCDRRALMHCHLSWHLALAALAAGRTDLASEAFRTAVRPGGAWGPALNVVTDAASFLWRAELAGEPRDQPLWNELHDYSLRAFPKAGIAFADVHIALVCIATGDHTSLQRLLAELRERIAAGRLPAGPVVVTIAEGCAAYARGDWDEAIDRLSRADPEVVRIGGSRAQRDLVGYTLLSAYLRSGRGDDARAWIARRSERRPAIEVAGLAALTQ